ncbi:MAG: LysR family transcriptional regulator, partial [Algicola sp.]|nr:LysR family transcriptional regulator [Algicola sp.]
MINYLRHMTLFCRIVECGSISGAADSLEMSKSVLSQHLKALEQALDVMLLRRTTRRQVLTPAGKEFYQRCVQMNEIAEQAWQGARETKLVPVGPIKISAPNAFIDTIIAPVIGELTARYPDIRPHLVADDQRLDLLEHEIDLAIRVGELPSSGYRQRRIGSFTDVLCAGPDFISQNQSSLSSLTTTTTLDYIANSWQGSKISQSLQHNQTGDTIELDFVASRFANSLQAVLAMAKAGAGIALIPDFVFSQYQQNGELVALLPDYHSPSVPV